MGIVVAESRAHARWFSSWRGGLSDVQVPAVPKLLAVPTRWDRFVNFKAGLSLDAEYRHDLPVEADLGIPLDLLEVPSPGATNAPRVSLR